MREGDRTSWTITLTPDDVMRFLDFRQAAMPRKERGRPSYFVDPGVCGAPGAQQGAIVPGPLSMGVLSRLMRTWLAPSMHPVFRSDF